MIIFIKSNFIVVEITQKLSLFILKGIGLLILTARLSEKYLELINFGLVCQIEKCKEKRVVICDFSFTEKHQKKIKNCLKKNLKCDVRFPYICGLEN
ncbi:hypothetical protein D6779_06455 [Candidatus Parcubacteria bacterium]|nr:MAG: hypothetical protein D6779_06455 [Candidatus Parcubacteria bacterium]